MATRKQYLANQKNAQRSTGPRTLKGKALASKNAIKHGLLSKAMVLPDEDPSEFEQHYLGVQQCYQPANAMEEILVQIIAVEMWRLTRVYRVEASILSKVIFQERKRRAEDLGDNIVEIARERQGLSEDDPNPDLSGPEARQYKKAQADYEQAESQEQGEVTMIGEAFMRNISPCDPFDRLSRYGTGIQRNWYRALHELERMQASRKGNLVPAPVGTDIEMPLSKNSRVRLNPVIEVN
jgi:hypothetical protein